MFYFHFPKKTRPDIRLRSIVYKIIPGLYAKERQNISHDGFEQRIFLNGTSSGAHALVSKYEKQTFDICYEDEEMAKQYFYDPEEPIRYVTLFLVVAF